MPTPKRELELHCRALGRVLKRSLPPDVVFCLMLGVEGAEGWNAWITNGRRPEMVNMLKEFLVKLDLHQAGDERTILP